MNTTRLRLALLALAAGAAFAPAAHAQSEPIVFVHGYSGSGSNWDVMAARFTASGYPSRNLYKFDYSSLVNSNTVSAIELRNFVNTVRARHGNAKVAVVAHSNGGLVSRSYLVNQGGSAATRRFVSLGTPHKGTTYAYACVSPACLEMRPGSSFLRALGTRGCDRSLWSATDGIILPAANAQCGTSTRTADVDHLALLTDTSVYNQVRQQLR